MFDALARLQRDFIVLDSGVLITVVDAAIDADDEYMRQRGITD
jgi:hypothetical protein